MTTAAAESVAAEYEAAWKALPRHDRGELVRAATRGHRAVNRWDAALMLWWTQKQLSKSAWSGMWLGLAIAATVIGWYWIVEGFDVRGLLAANPLLPVFLLIPWSGSRTRKIKLRHSARLNAAVLAGRSFDGPPDPEEAERLLARARIEGWFRGTRPQR